ncbi:MAG: DNA-binding CsgD family transcriptional regulator, partial [Glaciecola sp.]
KVAMNDYAGAADMVEDGLELVREVGDVKALLGTLISGTVALGMDRGQGVELGFEGVELARPLGSTLFATAGYAWGLCLEWSDQRVADHEELLREVHSAAHRSGIPELIVGIDGILYGHQAAAGELIETYEKMTQTRAYAIEHAPRTLATWAILPGLWTWHWTGEHDEVLVVAEEAMRFAGPPGSLSHTMALITRATSYYICRKPREQILLDSTAAIERLRDSGSDHWLTVALVMRSAVLHERGEHIAARADVAEARRHLPPTGWIYARGGVAWAEGLDPAADLDRLLACAVEYLELSASLGWVTGWPTAMFGLGARSLHRMGQTDRAVVLLGVVEGICRSVKVRGGDLIDSYLPGCMDQVRAEVFDGLAGDAIESGLAAGRAIAWQDAIALLRVKELGSSTEPRPVSGWGALTPAEVDVARKVAEGLTNPEVAAALFVSTNTVKTHLKNIYAKLEISSRASLAATVTEQPS